MSKVGCGKVRPSRLAPGLGTCMLAACSVLGPGPSSGVTAPSDPPSTTQPAEAEGAAPDFEAQGFDGQKVRLRGFRGKYVLLDFWATWCGPCIAETPHLQAVWKEFGRDPRFVLLSVSLDADVDAPRQYAREHHLDWTQAWLGADEGWSVVESYGQEGIPSIFLIGPDGRIVAQDIRGEELVRHVRSALSGRRGPK